ncbi:hypothetical protein PVAP13_5KG294514 [Panicum virgatum]|uniref:Uncharacterized protein n=1 Tax=Panicum virgatum TaxID=38727 RepID=A0A8T0SMX6_PANVG|nr:hypothetical protein PVAP13_5KG294514 [Panicum virgatum]
MLHALAAGRRRREAAGGADALRHGRRGQGEWVGCDGCDGKFGNFGGTKHTERPSGPKPPPPPPPPTASHHPGTLLGSSQTDSARGSRGKRPAASQAPSRSQFVDFVRSVWLGFLLVNDGSRQSP